MRRFVLLLVLSSILLSACLRPSDVSVDPGDGTGDSIREQVLVRAMPRRKEGINDERHGREVWFAYGAVIGTSGTEANGVATAHFLEDATYVIGIQLNIAPPAEGQFYEGWLMKGIDPGDWVSVGHFQQGNRESSQTLRLESSKDLRKYGEIAVSREADDGNPAPGTVVAQGSLRVTQR